MSILQNLWGIYYTTASKKEIKGLDSESQLDILLKNRHAPSNIHEWADVRAIGEHTVSTDGGAKFLQLARYARNVFSAQPRRQFVHGFILARTEMELHVFDRSGTFSGEPFDIHKEPERFIRVICGHCMMSDEQLGLDTFIEHEGEKELVTVDDEFSRKDRRLQLEPRPIAHQAAVVGRDSHPAFAQPFRRKTPFFTLLSKMDFMHASTLKRYLRTQNGGNTWALITGGSDGIRQGFAQELTATGFNLVLHGRNLAKLSRVKNEIILEHPKIQIRMVIADAGSFMPTSINDIVTALQDIRLTVLINNVGGTGVLDANFKTFQTHSADEIDAMINLIIRFTVLLSHGLLRLLKKNTPALIMTTGFQAHVGTPYMSVYSGTKGFIHAFSKGLAVEFNGEGDKIEVIEILVSSVQSQQNQTEKATYFVPTSRSMAKSALNRVGCGSVHVVAYFPHALQQSAYRLLPTRLLDRFTVSFLKPLAGKTERKW